MPRMFSEVLDQMRRLVAEVPEAKALVERFASRTVVKRWRRKCVYKPTMEFRFRRGRHPSPLFVIMLPDGSSSPPDDALVWRRQASLGHGGDVADVLFVDAIACHEEWIALKAIHEYAVAEAMEAFRETLFHLVPVKGLSLGQIACLVAPVTTHLLARQEAMLARVMDRCLRGRIMDRVNRLKRSASASVDTEVLERFGRQLMRQINELTHTRWPDPRNHDEHHARYELLHSTTRGLVLLEFVEKPLVH